MKQEFDEAKQNNKYGFMAHCLHCWACRNDNKRGCIALPAARTAQKLCEKAYGRMKTNGR